MHIKAHIKQERLSLKDLHLSKYLVDFRNPLCIHYRSYLQEPGDGIRDGD